VTQEERFFPFFAFALESQVLQSPPHTKASIHCLLGILTQAQQAIAENDKPCYISKMQIKLFV